MALVRLPIAGQLVALELPQDYQSIAAQFLISAALAYGRVGKRITAPERWARAALSDALAKLGSAESPESGHQALRRRIDRWQRHTPGPQATGTALADLFGLMLTGATSSADYSHLIDPCRQTQASKALAAVIGHELQDASHCSACAQAALDHWEAVLYVLDVPEAAVRDTHQALVEARVLPRLDPQTARVRVLPRDEDLF